MDPPGKVGHHRRSTLDAERSTGVDVRERVPLGHKVALVTFVVDQEVRRARMR